MKKIPKYSKEEVYSMDSTREERKKMIFSFFYWELVDLISTSIVIILVALFFQSLGLITINL